MATELTRTQVDRLGDRLRKGHITEADLRLLDQYRRSFSEAYEGVVEAVRDELGLEPTGRPAKSTTSIADKLRRESIRLTQIQDIAGCRLIVPDIANQESVVQSLTSLFEHTTVSDRRQKPSHGYRAVHVIINSQGKLIEIQVRTALQHLWAELSEKWSDVVDPAIKYGGGDEFFQTALTGAAEMVAKEEALESQVANRPTDFQEHLSSLRENIVTFLRDTIERAEEFKGEGDDISD
jgi:ppGpp synthetase/RelA/SpoT-type nucleotidyltranferase